MEIYDISVNGEVFDKEENFRNYALTLVVKDREAEKMIRANLRYYPAKHGWDLNPIFHEYTDAEKETMINQIIQAESFKTVFETTDYSLEG